VAVGPQDTSAVSGRRVAVTSTDGSNWVLDQWRIHGVEYGGSDFVNGIAFGNGQFVVVGGGWDAAPNILTSTDGVNWVPRQLSAPFPILYGIGYGNGRFVAVGNGCMILQSGSIIDLSIARGTGSGPLTLSLEGPIGLDYTIQTSSDLVSWQDVTKISNAKSNKIILNGLPVAPGRQFYRAMSQ
jgi:hypothetical protein